MRQITIRLVVDVVSVLETESLTRHLFMFDNNRLHGSIDQNTSHLATAVAPGDQIIWSVVPIECEAYAALSAVDVPAEFVEVTKNTYPGTNVSYWTGVVKKPVGDLSYGLTFELGTRTNTVSTDRTSRLIDANGVQRSSTKNSETSETAA